MDTLTGKIDVTVAASRHAQRISNTVPTASIYLFNDSMSAQGQSQVSSVASRNAWQTPLPTGTHNSTPIVRNIHRHQPNQFTCSTTVCQPRDNLRSHQSHHATLGRHHYQLGHTILHQLYKTFTNKEEAD
jgi:hypothetical protein